MKQRFTHNINNYYWSDNDLIENIGPHKIYLCEDNKN